MVSRDMQTSVIKALPLLLIGLALTPAGCVIATEYETIVGDIDEPVLIHGAHLVADGVIQIEARNVDTLAFDVLATTDATSHIAALGTDLYLYSYEDTIPAEYWTAGWGGAGARAELRIMAKVPGQADVPVDVVSDPDWGACYGAAASLADFRDACTASQGTGIVPVFTEGYCQVPSIVWHPNGCVTVTCGSVSNTTC